LKECKKIACKHPYQDLDANSDYCYAHFWVGSGLNGMAARNYCSRQSGGQLASIHNRSVNDKLHRMARTTSGGDEHKRTWMGNVKLGGQWMWLDLTPWNYAYWDKGWNSKSNGQHQPSGDGDCGEMFENGTWNDLHCTHHTRYQVFCEIRKNR